MKLCGMNIRITGATLCTCGDAERFHKNLGLRRVRGYIVRKIRGGCSECGCLCFRVSAKAESRRRIAARNKRDVATSYLVE